MPKLNFPQGDPISASFTAGQQRHQRRTGASGSWAEGSGGDDYSDPTVGDVALTGANALTSMAGADPQSLIGSLGSYLGINGDDEQAGQQGQGQQESWNPLAGLWTGLAGPVHAAIQNRPATKQERLNQLNAGVQSVMLAGGAAEGAEALRGRVQPSIQPPPQPEFSAPARLRAPLDEGAAPENIPPPPPPSPPTDATIPQEPTPVPDDAVAPTPQPVAAKPAKPPAPTAPEPVREPGKWYYDNINESLKSWQPKGTADQLMAHLKKSKGALEEADTIGLTDWLKEQPKSVSREDVQQFLDQNKIDVQEVQHGGGETKYASYQEPGGENYRELLLTKPSATQADGGSYHSSHWNEPNILAHIRMNDRTLPDGRKALFIEEVQSDWHQQGRKKAYTNPGDIKAADDALYTAQHNINNFRKAYTQWHNDRVMSDPAKRARLEQLQAQYSDAQDAFYAARNNDSTVPAATYEELRRQVFNAESQLNTFKHEAGSVEPYQVDNHIDSALSNADPTTPYGTDIRQWSQKYHELQDAYRKASDRANAVHDGVPDAPFKGDGWKKLALKRILTYAADNGYDGVGWTPGSVQAKRYSLSQHVNNITWGMRGPRFGEGKRLVSIAMPNDDLVMQVGSDGKVETVNHSGHQQFVGKGLDEVIGKDVAQKIMEEDDGKLEGGGLDIGGSGMKGFYDKELPNLMNDIMKKHGQKVQHPQHGPWEVFDPANGAPVMRFGTEAEASDYADKHKLDYDRTGTPNVAGEQPRMGLPDMHYIDLPPAVRRKISSTGMPLFIGAGAATGLATLANSANSRTNNSAPQSPAPHDPITQSFLAGRANLKSPD